jgi:hypothetical protein
LTFLSYFYLPSLDSRSSKNLIKIGILKIDLILKN